MTQKAKPSTAIAAFNTAIESLIFSFQFPAIAYAFYSDNPIEIIRRKRLNGKLKNNKILVDRKTGFLINFTEEFLDIYKFDQKTFPDNDSVPIKNVSYWNKSNQYIESS